MTGMPGRVVTEESEVRACAAQVRSTPEFSSSVSRVTESAAEVLGWPGTVLPPVKMLGRYVVATAELMPDAHAERLCCDAGPVLDRAETSTWVWPEMDGRVPPPAAMISGVLAPARHWRSALTAAVPFAKFTAAGIIVPRSVALADDFAETCLFRARQFGLAVLSAEGPDVQVELPGRTFEEAPPAEHTAVSRRVNEIVYQQLLTGSSPAPTPS